MQNRPSRYSKPKQGIDNATIALAFLITSLFYCLPLGRYSIFGETSDFRVYDFAFFFFIVLFALPRANRIITLLKYRSGFHHWYFLLVLFVWFSLLLTYFFGGMDRFAPAVIRAVRLTEYFFLAAFIIAVANTPRKLAFLLGVFYLNIVIQAGLSFFQGLDLLPSFWPGYWLAAYGELPVGTLSPHHKHLGVVMVIGIALSVSMIRITHSPVKRVLLLGAIGMMLTASIFTGARTSWLGIAALILGFELISRNFRFRNTVIIIAAVAVFGLVAYDFVSSPVEEQIRERIIDPYSKMGYEGLYKDRRVIYTEFIPNAMGKFPWLLLTGSGFQNLQMFIGASGAHNNYVHVLLELGLIGAVLYFRFLYVLYVNLTKADSTHVMRRARLVANGARAAFIAVLFTMLVGETLWAQYSMFTLTAQLMTLFGLATAPLYWPAETAQQASGEHDSSALAKGPPRPAGRRPRFF